MKFFGVRVFGKKKADTLKQKLWSHEGQFISSRNKERTRQQPGKNDSNFVFYNSKGRPRCMTCTFRIEQTPVSMASQTMRRQTYSNDNTWQQKTRKPKKKYMNEWIYTH